MGLDTVRSAHQGLLLWTFNLRSTNTRCWRTLIQRNKIGWTLLTCTGDYVWDCRDHEAKVTIHPTGEGCVVYVAWVQGYLASKKKPPPLGAP